MSEAEKRAAADALCSALLREGQPVKRPSPRFDHSSPKGLKHSHDTHHAQAHLTPKNTQENPRRKWMPNYSVLFDSYQLRQAFVSFGNRW